MGESYSLSFHTHCKVGIAKTYAGLNHLENLGIYKGIYKGI